MKKKVLVVLFIMVMVTAGVFADHPKNWGLGFEWASWQSWKSNNNYNRFHNDFGLSLKAPSVPLFWGIYLNLDSYNGGDHFGINVTGDYYILDKPLVKEIFLNWYLGLGGRFGFDSFNWGSYSNSTLFLGARGVAGLSWQLPLGGSLDALEIFFDMAPSLGIDFSFGEQVRDDNKVRFPAGGWGWDLGARLWF